MKKINNITGINWFTCKVKYAKQTEEGTYKNVTESYLLPAYSFTDAEARIYKEKGEVIKGEFDVISLVKTNLIDIFLYEESDIWWQCKIALRATIDEKEKESTEVFFVSAENVEQAYNRMFDSLVGFDYKIKSIIESSIVEVFENTIDE